jgi:hypothetical protein
MTLFFFISLCVSAFGLVLLLGFKRYEMRTGRVVFARLRPAMRRVIHPIVLFVQYLLPFMARRSIAVTVRAARAGLTATLARVTLYLEATLARMLAAVQQAMQPRRGGGQASSFLQEVADHKRRLLKDPAEKRAIFEEYQ